MKHLQQKDIRIILCNFDHDMARKVFCSVSKSLLNVYIMLLTLLAHSLVHPIYHKFQILKAIRQKMLGPRYVWIILGDYPDRWWAANDTSITCSPEQLKRHLNGYLATDVLSLETSEKKTIATMVTVTLT